MIQSRILFLFIACLAGCASARTFYVAPDGTDDADGTLTRPFGRIQDAVDRMQAGDTCIVRGGVYSETVEFSRSGEEGAPIRVQAYNDEQVILDGSVPVSNVWKKHKGRIYKTTVDQNIEQLFVGKQMMIEARWPNMTFGQRFDRSRWATAEKGSTHGLVLSRAAAETGIDWTGAMACLSVAHQWWTWNRPITKHEAGSDQLEYDANLVGLCNYDPEFWKTNEVSSYTRRVWDDDSFYLFGKLEALDAETEWHYDAETKTLYFYAPGGVDPTGLEVRCKSRNYGIRAKDQNHLEIKGIDFFACTFLLEDCNDCLVEECELLYPTWSRTITEYDADRKESVITKVVGNSNTVRKCSLAYSNNMGLMMMGSSNVVENCIIHDVNWTGTLIYPALQLSASPHLGVNWFNTIQYPPTKRTIENSDVTSYGNRASSNTLFNCGNALLVYHAADSIVEYNHVYEGGKACKDVSLIYGCWPFSRGSIIRYNWVHGCHVEEKSGTGGIGIRADDQSRNNIFHHNVIWDIGSIGLNIKGEDNLAYHNTIFDIGSRNPKPGYGIFADTVPEPVKIWAVQWPQLLAQNQWLRLVNNAGLRMGTKDREHRLFKKSGFIHHNLNQEDVAQYLVDPENFDFRPRKESPLVDAGTVLPGYNDDFKGSAPDIGAYEADGEHWVAGADWKEQFTLLEE